MQWLSGKGVTSPREPLAHDKAGGAKGTWTKLVIFTVNQQKESADGAKVRVFTAKYEAEIEYDPSKHRPPGLRVISAWRPPRFDSLFSVVEGPRCHQRRRDGSSALRRLCVRRGTRPMAARGRGSSCG